MMFVLILFFLLLLFIFNCFVNPENL
jgi:hypothetical protein